MFLLSEPGGGQTEAATGGELLGGATVVGHVELLQEGA